MDRKFLIALALACIAVAAAPSWGQAAHAPILSPHQQR
jgi:hypothetical protein